MTYKPVFLLCLLCCFTAGFGQLKKHQTPLSDVSHGLKLSANHRYLVDAQNGKPVFILATTAWNINALTYAEVDTLIQSIAGNGFNSLMFCLDFYPQATEANVYGEKAYTGPDTTSLNPAYFKFCDYIVAKCTKLGIYPMLYTMWSGKTSGIMNHFTPAKLFTIGKQIGERYKTYRNVILVAGGESSPPYIDTARVNAMGRGLRAGSDGNNLLSVHPCSPHSNSEFYAGAAWLDFYMCQGKSNLGGITYDLTKLIAKDYQLPIVRPTMLAEHRYESGTSEDPIIQRRNLYLSVFSGGFGYAYGHNALWQMTPHTAQPWMLKSWNPGVADWKLALNTPAQQQLQYIKKLLYALPYLDRIPDQSLLLSPQPDSIHHKIAVMRNGDPNQGNATYIMAYLASPQPIKLNTGIIKATQLQAWWFKPANGRFERLGQPFKNIGGFEMEKRGNGDGVLVVGDGGMRLD